ncbi:MAG: S1C family serine protease [Terriglobia bacterium]
MATEKLTSFEALSGEIAAAVEKAAASVVAIRARRHALSSGILWREDAVVTAHHTVRRDEGIEVLLPDGSAAAARLAGRDPSTDLAVLQVTGASAKLAERGEAAPLKPGHLVLAVGRVESGPRASLGVLGVAGGPWRTWRGGEVERLLRVEIDLHPTLSGAALADGSGRILGMLTAGLSRTRAVAIPPATIDRVVTALLEKGHIPRGYLGLGLYPVLVHGEGEEATAQPGGHGAVVVSIEPGGPASQAGVLVGDVVVSLDGKAVKDTSNVQELLGPGGVGKTVAAAVMRGGKPLALQIKVGERHHPR